jgi:3'-phosphoadenosine 5'-phosphosulfate sulfotransferase (PAPS reductase)/FAD synthetase
MEKLEKHIVSLSGGKDSTAMLLRMLEEGMPVDIILFCNTGMEFEGLYRHIDKLEQYIGRPITRLKSPQSFEYLIPGLGFDGVCPDRA